MSRHIYPTDTQGGIRPINKIRSLPSGDLTDEEFAKEFADRFGAEAMILAYIDKEDKLYCFGRLRNRTKVLGYYRLLRQRIDQIFDVTRKNVTEIDD